MGLKRRQGKGVMGAAKALTQAYPGSPPSASSWPWWFLRSARSLDAGAGGSLGEECEGPRDALGAGKGGFLRSRGSEACGLLQGQPRWEGRGRGGGALVQGSPGVAVPTRLPKGAILKDRPKATHQSRRQKKKKRRGWSGQRALEAETGGERAARAWPPGSAVSQVHLLGREKGASPSPGEIQSWGLTRSWKIQRSLRLLLTCGQNPGRPERRGGPPGLGDRRVRSRCSGSDPLPRLRDRRSTGGVDLPSLRGQEDKRLFCLFGRLKTPPGLFLVGLPPPPSFICFTVGSPARGSQSLSEGGNGQFGPAVARLFHGSSGMGGPGGEHRHPAVADELVRGRQHYHGPGHVQGAVDGVRHAEHRHDELQNVRLCARPVRGLAGHSSPHGGISGAGLPGHVCGHDGHEVHALRGR